MRLLGTRRHEANETSLFHVKRRKFHLQQLKNALEGAQSSIIKAFVIPRDAKLNEEIDGGSVGRDDVIKALFQLDRPGVRPGNNLNKDQCIITILNLEHTSSRIVCGVTLEKDCLSPRQGQRQHTIFHDTERC